jgi:hypothetical protein
MNFMEGLMNKKHLAMSTLPAAPLNAAGASNLAPHRHHGGDRAHRDGTCYCQPDHDVVIIWREHHLRPPPWGRH